MRYHIELRRSHYRACAFNLDADALHRTVLEPWISGAPLRFGDREWEPSKTSLRVIEGEQLAAVDLAHGQGWHHAERGGRDVARELLAAVRPALPASAAIVAASEQAHDEAAALLQAAGILIADWAGVRGQLIVRAAGGPPADVAVVLVVEAAAPADWHFDAGLALGALHGRVAIVALSRDGMAQFAGLAVTPLDPADPAAPGMLAAALRGSGLEARTG